MLGPNETDNGVHGIRVHLVDLDMVDVCVISDETQPNIDASCWQAPDLPMSLIKILASQSTDGWRLRILILILWPPLGAGTTIATVSI